MSCEEASLRIYGKIDVGAGEDLSVELGMYEFDFVKR